MLFEKELKELKYISNCFAKNNIYDIYTNSKIYEILMSEQFGHELINGHAYTPDARDEFGNLYEYKHFKLSSSNHTWTFNDFTDKTIQKLVDIKSVYFAVIDDSFIVPQIIDVYCVPGREVANYLRVNTPYIQNKRRMINISESQIINQMYYERITTENIEHSELLVKTFETIHKIEVEFHVTGLLTSNKIWELLVAYELGHSVNSEQKKHDAVDIKGNTFEYKVAVRPLWTFQDISENVLNSYLKDYGIILAIVDKRNVVVTHMYICNPIEVVKKLQEKMYVKVQGNKEIRRMSTFIGMRDLREMIDGGAAKCLL